MAKPWRYRTGRKAHNRVTVYERPDGASIYIQWWEDGERHQKNLRTILGQPVTDRMLAVRIAHHFAEQIELGKKTAITNMMLKRHIFAGIEDALIERFLMEEHELLSHTLPVEPLCGIYFLLDGSEVVYVGQSVDILQRLTVHRQRPKVAFTACAYQPFNEDDLDRAEAFFIERFNPHGNIHTPGADKGDRRFMASAPPEAGR